MLQFPVCHWGGASKWGLTMDHDDKEWLVHEANDLPEGNGGIFTISVHVIDAIDFSIGFGTMVAFSDDRRFGWAGFDIKNVRMGSYFSPNDVDGTGDDTFSAVHENLSTVGINLNDKKWHHILYSASNVGSLSSVLYVDNINIPVKGTIDGTIGAGFTKINSTIDPPDPTKPLHMSITGQQFDTTVNGSSGMSDVTMADLWIDFGASQTWSSQANRDKWNFGNIIDGVTDKGGGIIGDIHLQGKGESWKNNAVGFVTDYMSISDFFTDNKLRPGIAPKPTG